MQSFGKPFILTSFLCLAEIYCVLNFTLPIAVFITFSLLASAVVSFSLIRQKKYLSAVFFSFLLVLSCLNPYFSLGGKEKQAKELFLQIKDEKDTVFTATVSDFNDYGSYSVTFCLVTHKNGEKLPSPCKVRIGSYSASPLEKGDIITFKGKAQFSRDVDSDTFNTAQYLRSKNTFIDFPSAEVLSSRVSGKSDIFSRLQKSSADL